MSKYLSKLRKLTTKKETLELNGEEFEISSLTFPELTEFSNFVDSKQTQKALDYILFRTLRKSIPTKEVDRVDGASDEDLREEINNIDSKLALEIITKVQLLTGLTDEKSLEEAKKKAMADLTEK